MSENLTTEEVRQVAELARLKLSEKEIQAFRPQLAAIIHYIDMIDQLDVEGVEPMAHPLPMTNHLEEDGIRPSLDSRQVLDLAPATEGDFLVVPKVIGEGGG